MDLDVPNALELSLGVVRSVIHSPGVVPTIVKTKNIRKKCQHHQQKHNCRICSAHLWCRHGNRRSNCRDCGVVPTIVKKKYQNKKCPHNKRRSVCRICSPHFFCIHNALKRVCRKCENPPPKQPKCPHGKTKGKCRVCSPQIVCVHDSLKYTCQKCRTPPVRLYLCEHGNYKYHCRKCGNLRKKTTCINCIEWPDSQTRNPAYGEYCCRCYVHLFPEDPKSLNSRKKTKEIQVKDEITQNFADYNFIHDKVMLTGSCCTHRRSVDHRCMLGNTMLCIETDEFAHRSYKKDDEEHRYSDLFMAISCKYIFIRFNPDPNREARCAKTDFDAKLSVLIRIMRAQIKRIEEGANTELVEIHKLFCCKKCLENNSALCVCEAEM